MKRIVMLMIALMVMVSSVYGEGFSDVKTNDWYYQQTIRLVDLGVIKGYNDGSFRPAGIVTKAEYIAMVSRALGMTAERSDGEHWAVGIVKVAKQNGLVVGEEFTEEQFDQPISRFESALVASRALDYLKENTGIEPMRYAKSLYDLDNMNENNRSSVLNVVANGVMTGYPDGTFSGDKTLNRAEASVVISRIINPGERKKASEKPPLVNLEIGQTLPIERVINGNKNDINSPIYFLLGNTVTLVPMSTYNLKFTAYKTSDSLTADGDTGHILFVRNHDLVYKSTGYMSDTTGHSYHSLDKGYDLSSIDYIGFYKSGDTNIKLIENPFKK